MSITDTAPVLEVVDLSKRYGAVRAVDEVTFGLGRGEILGLLGPNGAGKTTILEIVEGLRSADAGSVRLFGRPWHGRDKAVRARIGIQLQASAMLPNLTVRELLALQASFYPRALAVPALLDQVGLGLQASTRSERVSGGQLQRLAVALALVGNPDLVLLDEPTTGFDPAARRELWSVLDRLRGEGRSILLTTHYMEEAEALADRVAVLDHGRIVGLGSVAELSARSGGERVVFAADPGLSAVDLLRLPAVTDVATRNGLTSLVTTDAGHTLIGLVEVGRRLGRLPEGLAVRRPTLEEIYLELTGRALDTPAAA